MCAVTGMDGGMGRAQIRCQNRRPSVEGSTLCGAGLVTAAVVRECRGFDVVATYQENATQARVNNSEWGMTAGE